jgi:LPS-assembly protein
MNCLQSQKRTKTIINHRRNRYSSADRVTGYYKQEVEASGNAELRHGNNVLCRSHEILPNDRRHRSHWKRQLDRPKDTLKGKDLHLNLQTEEGHMSDPRYYIKDGKGRGAGSTLLFEGKDNYRLNDANYTTCPEGNHDWYIRAKELEIDNKKEVGTARHVSIMFKDTPILYSPWLDFSYSGKRKTGMLTPLLGYNVKTGFDMALPFYLNIAPNIDATAPRVMRGLCW